MQHTDRETIQPQSVRYANVRGLAQLVLRHAIAARRSGTRLSIDNMWQYVRPVCDTAREDGLRAEQLLILVKQAWDQLVENHELDRSDSDVALSEVVTLCIKEFYRTGQES